MSIKKHEFYCALCSSPRKIRMQRTLTLVEFGYSVVASLILSLLVWQKLDFRAIAFFGVILAIAEILIQIRWRLSVACPYCGFDPVLYLKDKKQTQARVKDHYDRRMQNPLTLLSKKPNLNLPKATPPTRVPVVSKGNADSVNKQI